MLNRQLSSSSSSPSFSSSDNKNNIKNKKQSPLSPLRDLNGIAAAFPSHTSSGSSSSSTSSSISVEAPRGCLRFFLSNSSASKTPIGGGGGGGRPKSLSKKTPKSAPSRNPSKLISSSRSNKPLKENLPSRKVKPKKNPPCLYHWQSAKKPYSKTVPKPKHPTGLGISSAPVVQPASASGEFSQNQRKQWPAKMVDESGEPPKLLNLTALGTAFVENSTPVGKLACGSVLGCEFDDKIMEEDPTQITAATTTTITTTTPPVQASVSPEIQCGSSMLVSAATPACYGAGHIISGVADRRKCRAKGILTVGEIDSHCPNANIFDNGDDEENLSKSKIAFVPLPAEASMRWLLPPCDKEDDNQKRNPENGLHSCRKSASSATLHSVSSPSPGHGISSDFCNIFENSSTTSTNSSRRRSKIVLLSPSQNPSFQGILGASSSQVAGCSSVVSPHDAPICKTVNSPEQQKQSYDLAGENSPFSINSLGSGNMIQTPESDTNSDRHVGLSCLNAHDHQNHDFQSEMDSVAEVLLRASLSPNTQISMWDAPGLSFQFSDLISPSSSIDLTQLSNIWDSRASCISSSTLEEMSVSQMRISWRDGLVSRIFEMDEYDCCRCFSDDENDANECSIGNFKSSPGHELNADVGNIVNFSNGFGSPEVVGHELKSDGQGQEKVLIPISNPCTESIYTDGGGLVTSGDSDWALCYKNQLFES